MKVAACLLAAAIAGCQAGSPPSSSSAPPPIASAPAATATAPPPSIRPSTDPTCAVDCSPSPESANPATEEPSIFPGVVESRPDGWFHLANEPVTGYPKTYATAYGADGEDQPIEEGPGRLVLYESFGTGNDYLQDRVALAKANGAHKVAVEVVGVAVDAWVTDSTGELMVGWELPGKSEVLVANKADFTLMALVTSAESVADCCG